MALGMEVGLGPGDFVFDGDPVPPPEKGHSPHLILGPRLLWPKGWMAVMLIRSQVIMPRPRPKPENSRPRPRTFSTAQGQAKAKATAVILLPY